MTDIAANPAQDDQPNLLVIEEDQPTLVIAEASESIAIVASEPEVAALEIAEPEVAEAAAPAAAPVVAQPAPAPAPAPVAVAVLEPEPAPAIAVAAPGIVEAAEPPVAAEAVPLEDDAPAAKVSRFDLRGAFPMIVVSIAAMASLVAAVGTVVATRAVAHTNAVLEEVEAHRAKMRRLDQLIDEVDGLRQREQIALVRVEQIATSQPATSADVRSAIAGLQIAMAKHEPGGNTAILATLRDGQAELAERISIIYRRVERMDEKLAAFVSSSPKAKP